MRMKKNIVKKKKKSGIDRIFDGRGDEIRTHDLFVPNEALYQAEPHPDVQRNYVST